jgi:hypothetical protein
MKLVSHVYCLRTFMARFLATFATPAILFSRVELGDLRFMQTRASYRYETSFHDATPSSPRHSHVY